MAKIKGITAANLLENYKFITIEPYENPNITTTWHAKTGCSGEPEASVDLPIAYTDQTGSNRFLTGLDDRAYKLKNLNEEEKKAKIDEIHSTIEFLKTNFMLDPKVLEADNFNFWGNPEMNIKVKRGEGLTFDIRGNYRDILKVFAIRNGGYPEIAGSYQEAASLTAIGKKVTHFLYQKEEVDDIKNSPKIEKAMLTTKFYNLYETSPETLFYVAVVLLPSSKSYGNRTTSTTLLTDLVNYIEGDEGTIKVNMKKRITEVRKVLDATAEEKMLKATVKIAEFLRIIKRDKEGDYSDIQTGELLGRTPEAVIEFLRNPIHLDIYQDIKNKVNEYWSKR